MRAAARSLGLLAVLACGACTLNFDRLFQGGGDAGFDVPHLPDGAVDRSCPAPVLLVAIDHPDTPSRGGTVARFSLTDASSARRCADVTGGGALYPSVRAVAALPDGTLAVAADEGVQLVDPSRDAIVAHYDVGGDVGNQALDVFALQSPDGTLSVAAAYGFDSRNSVANIALLDSRANLVARWPLNDTSSPALLGLDVPSLAASPDDPTHFLAVKPGEAAAYDQDPFVSMQHTVRASWPSSASLATVGTDGEPSRIAWTGVDTVTDTSGVYYLSPGFPAGSAPLGPAHCPSVCANSTFQHAVPDPTLNTAFVAVCASDVDSSLHLVRFASTREDECVSLLDGDYTGPERLWRVAIAR